MNILPELSYVQQTVRHAARQEVLPRFEQVGFTVKGDGSFLTEADMACNKYICQALKQRYPEVAFLSEEMTTSEQATLLKESEWLWCLDPLDGTSNFASGVPLFCSSLALIHQGEVIQAVTYDPVRDELFSAQRGQGAYLNGKALHCEPSKMALSQTIALVDYKRLSTPLAQAMVSQAPFGSQRNLGTCALEWAWIAANRGQLYLHGGMKLWDLAAGTLLLHEAGGYASTLNGEAVFNADMQPRSVVASSDEALFKQWLTYLQQQGS